MYTVILFPSLILVAAILLAGETGCPNHQDIDDDVSLDIDKTFYATNIHHEEWM